MNPPIDPVALYHEFEEKPFRPRRVHLTSGEFFDIVSRRHVMIREEYLDIGIQAVGEAFGICEELVPVAFTEIERFELLPVVEQTNC